MVRTKGKTYYTRCFKGIGSSEQYIQMRKCLKTKCLMANLPFIYGTRFKCLC